MTEKFKWAEITKPDHSEIQEFDVREVVIPVVAAFIWSDKIVDEVDETGYVLSYTSGFIMKIITEEAVYRGEETRFLYQTARIK